MAGISMMQKLLDNQLVSKFAKSLKHSDLPEGWADNPEIVSLAEEAYKEMGTDSPWFKAWFGNSKVVDKAGEPLDVFHGTLAKDLQEFDKGKIGSRFSYDDNGFFFDSNRNVAKDYSIDEFNPGKRGSVIPAFIRSENPLVIDNNLLRKEGMGPLLKEQDPIEFWDNYQDFAWDAFHAKKADGIIVDDGLTKMVVALEPTDIKHATRNRGTFNPADPNIYRGLIPAVGAGGLLALLGAEEAEAANQWNGRGVEELVRQLRSKEYKGGLLDVLSEEELAQLARKNPAYTEPQHSIDPDGVEHLYVSRMVKPTKKKDRMTPEQVGDVINSLTTSSRRRVVTTKGDKNGEHKEGMIVPHGESTYLAVLEPQDGKAGIYTAFRTKTKDLPKQMGRPVEVEGGNPHLTISPTGDLPTQRSLPAVTSGGTIPDSSKTSKALIPALTTGGVLVPGTADAGSGVVMPDLLSKATRWEDDFWPAMARQFGLGSRGVIEGLGSGATLGFGDPGKVISDLIGLPVPQTDIERQRVGLNSGVTDALTTFAGGAGAAKMATSPIVRGVGKELADKPLLGAGIGGILGLLGGY